MSFAQKQYNEIFRDDGTLKGFTMSSLSPQRGDRYWRVLVQFDQHHHNHKVLRRNINNNFTEVYAECVAFAAKYWGVSKKSQLFYEMMNTMDAFLVRYGIELKTEVRTVTLSTLWKNGECFSSTYINNPLNTK